MRAIMLMFDTLTRDFLPNYGCDFIKAPNFKRLEDRMVTFEEFYGGSLPCMPARRELHTGKYNFLHRGWGPLEPFDESAIDILSRNGVYTHMITDHSHYFEDGGCTYHTRYDSYESFRGQEGDRWIPRAEADLSVNTCKLNKTNVSAMQHLANRTRYEDDEENEPSVQCVTAGLDFIDHYQDKDNWFLQIECFDPHEPFYVPEKYRALYDCCDSHEAFNFPAYTQVGDKYTEEEIHNLRKEYCALLSMCDAQVGRLIDKMDEYNMWEDTLLIINTDHGFLLGEHDYIGKNFPPTYDEMVHTPFFMHVPGSNASGRRNSLAQTIDIPVTLLDYFGLHFETETDGKSLMDVYEKDNTIHDQILYGVHGNQINCYDGEYCYMKSTVDHSLPVYHETLMPTNMRGFVSTEWIDKAEMVDGGRHANYHRVMRIPVQNMYDRFDYPTVVYDKKSDPKQLHPIVDEVLFERMNKKLETALRAADAPEWQFKRMGIEK